MKKVLVTGAFGFIGSNMVKFLLDNTDYHIVGVDDGSGATNTQLMIDLQKENVGRISLAFMDFTEVSLYDIDVVYHFAATPRVSYSVEEPIETNDNNTTNNYINNDNNYFLKYLYKLKIFPRSKPQAQPGFATFGAVIN